jgi:2-haloacid dehalogenase
MSYEVFLFDADDTLFDFKASERIAFFAVMNFFDIDQALLEEIFTTYKRETQELWRQLELGKVEIEFLKVERFRRVCERHGLFPDPARMAAMYLEILSESSDLMEGAVEIVKHLSARGEIGILTNGVGHVQRRRLKSSPLAPYVQFMAVSEDAGFAKPDARFFEYACKLSRKFSKEKALMIGDRVEADILGAHNYGIDSCLFNPLKLPVANLIAPKFHIHRLEQLRTILE